MNWLKKGRRQFIIFGITILFAAFLIQLNQVEREGLYETEGKTFEKAKVVEIKKDIQQSREIRLEINWFPFDY